MCTLFRLNWAMLHCREGNRGDAHTDLLQILSQHTTRNRTVILHSCSIDVTKIPAWKAVCHTLYFCVGSPSWRHLSPTWFAEVTLERILVESDTTIDHLATRLSGIYTVFAFQANTPILVVIAVVPIIYVGNTYYLSTALVVLQCMSFWEEPHLLLVDGIGCATVHVVLGRAAPAT